MDATQPPEVELDITGIAHGGVSVARLDGRVVFVTDTLPGERVRARLTDTRKSSFWRADTVEVLTPSEHRRDHIWSEASVTRAPERRAGGAEFGHITLDHQRQLKSDVLTDALSRFAGISRDVTVDSVEDSADSVGTGWRTRMRAHVDEAGRVGPYAARSHQVIGVDSYPLAVPEAATVLPDQVQPGSAEWIDVVVPHGAEPVIMTGSGRHAHGSLQITERVGEREFRLDASGFWQVHRNAAATLSAAVSAALDPNRFDPAAANHDLYGGVGLLAAALADRGGRSTRVTSVESYAPATEFAAENLSEWVGARAQTARVDRYLRQVVSTATSRERDRFRAASIVLDPPRQGAGKEVVSSLIELAPHTIIYVACDPVALARDLAGFRNGGYDVAELTAYDLFPNTHHLETIAVLHRN
ncbi:MAG: class I SAM-dependent RNA methyltransferase [Mycetocola sp.]